MEKRKRKLIIEQLDQKLSAFKSAGTVIRPPKGWLNAIRTALNMPLGTLGHKLNLSPQGVKALETREETGSITLNALQQAADAMEMRLVYAIIPKEESLETIIKKRATEMAREIVMRTSGSMKLEDQENSQQRLKKAITEKAEDLIEEVPKYLWL